MKLLFIILIFVVIWQVVIRLDQIFDWLKKAFLTWLDNRKTQKTQNEILKINNQK